MPRALLLVLLAVFATGCAGSGHGHHGDGMRILFGVPNGADAPLDASWQMTDESGAGVWNMTVTVAPNEIVEKVFAPEREGSYAVNVTAGAHQATFSFSTSACHGTTHINVRARGDAAHTETLRECHE